MADQVVSADANLETVIAAGLLDGESISIVNGATLTMTESNSVLIRQIFIIDGEFHVDGENITAGNVVNLCLEAPGFSATGTTYGVHTAQYGTFRVSGDWYSVGATDGTPGQELETATFWGSNIRDALGGAWVETGRRIDYDNAVGLTPLVDDWLNLTSDFEVMGRVVGVFDNGDGSGYLHLKYLTGTVADNDAIYIERVVDNMGPDKQRVWTAEVNNASGDIKAAGIYQGFFNSCRRSTNNENLGYTAGVFENHTKVLGTKVSGFNFYDEILSATPKLVFGWGVAGNKGYGFVDTAEGGFVPPSGCDVKVPNVNITSIRLAEWPTATVCGNVYDYLDVSGNYYTRYLPRIGWQDKGIGTFKILNVGQVAFVRSSGDLGPSSLDFESVASWTIGSGRELTPTSFDNCVFTQNPIINGAEDWWVDGRVGLSTNPKGGSFDDCVWGWSLEIIACSGYTMKNCIHIMSGGGNPIYLAYCSDFVIENAVIYGAGTSSNNSQFAAVYYSSDVHIKTSFCCLSRHGGDPYSDYMYSVLFSSSNNCSLIGYDLLEKGGSFRGLIRLQRSTDIKIRCVGGSFDFPRNMKPLGNNSAAVTYLDGGTNGLDIARCWTYGGTYTGPAANCVGWRMTNCGVHGGGGLYSAGAGDCQIKGNDGSYLYSMGALSNRKAGFGFSDAFLAAAGTYPDPPTGIHYGYIACAFPVEEYAGQYFTVISGTPVFTEDGGIKTTAGDIVEMESHYFARGMTGLFGSYMAGNTNGSYQGSWAPYWGASSMDLFFQFDIGSGYNGTWLDMKDPSLYTGANAVAIDPAVGVKIKFRIEILEDVPDFGWVAIRTNSSFADRKLGLYPIDQEEYTTTLTPLQAGSEVRIYRVSDGAELTGVEDSGASYGYTYVYTSDEVVDIVIHHKEYEPIRLKSITLSNADATIPVQQRFDRNYNNP